jgi:Epoxide hydrolase N terminus
VRSEPFSIHVDESVLADLRYRIGKTRWPGQIPGIGWQQGTDLAYLKQLLAYWADGFDWRAQEYWVNSFGQGTR